MIITAMSSQIHFSKASSAKKRKLKDKFTFKKACLTYFAQNAAN